MVDEQLYLSDGFEGLAEQLGGWKDDNPEMGLLALLPEAEKNRVASLQKICRDAGIPLFGAVFPALIVEGKFADSGVLLLRFDRMPRAFLVPGLAGEPERAAAAIAAEVSARREADSRPTLFMIFDGMLPNIGSILTDLYNDLGSGVVYAGVNAGSETFQPMPCLFDGESCFGEGVLVMLLPPAAGVVVDH